ncbi:MAG TPA: protease modulator HflK [Stellaceae bacterium]|nr:protease modulator HflK [Stellaceae bacterium]
MPGGDEIMRDAPSSGAWRQSIELTFRFLFVAVCAVGIGWCVSNFHQVPPDDQALVLRFGTVVRQEGAGLLLAWPAPIEQVVILPSGATQLQLRITPFVPEADSRAIGLPAGTYYVSDNPRENTGFLLTGDANVVHLEATVFYDITDPVAYMIEKAQVARALERLFIASAVSVCASRDLDSILVAQPEIADRPSETTMREQFRADLMNAVNQRLSALSVHGTGLGIRVTRVDVTPAIPTVAKIAFDAVLTATQGAETNIAEAHNVAQVRSQQANQDKDRILAEATAYGEAIVTKAEARTAPIDALARQAQGPSRPMLLQRLYYDMTGRILRQAGQVEAVDPKGGAHTILPGAAP